MSEAVVDPRLFHDGVGRVTRVAVGRDGDAKALSAPRLVRTLLPPELESVLLQNLDNTAVKAIHAQRSSPSQAARGRCLRGWCT